MTHGKSRHPVSLFLFIDLLINFKALMRFLYDGQKHIRKNAISYSVVIILVSTVGVSRAEDMGKSDQCFTAELNQIKTLPELKYMQTLDGRYLSLDEIFTTCHSSLPMCSLYEKFYYWHTEVREIVSNTPKGLINHKVRVYINTLAKCDPTEHDPLKLYEDVAEFYDESGSFRLLAIYIGEGQYGLLSIKRMKV